MRTKLALAVALSIAYAPHAIAAWTASGAGSSAARAVTMPSGGTPTLTLNGADVTVTWPQATFPNGDPVAGYRVTRSDTSGTPQAMQANCDTTVNVLTCTEIGVPNGTWRYAVTPVHNNWTGTQGPLVEIVVSFLSSGVITQLAQGFAHTCALIVDGTVRCWGRNREGQLGNGTTSLDPGPLPVQVAGITSAVAIAAGQLHSCAILADGSGRCWGSNFHGQIGDGTFLNVRTTPVQVTGLTGAVRIAGGQGHSCALLGDGTARCWGITPWVGDGTSSGIRSTPVAVIGLSNAITIAAGVTHTCSVLGDGTGRCWGSNGFGQLGNGTTSLFQAAPVTVAGLANALDIVPQGGHTCARLADGTVRCWGLNDSGQLGDGTTTDRLAPTPVPGLSGVETLASGQDNTCAAHADGTGRCWGANASGQLGDGSNTMRLTPVPVAAITGRPGITRLASHQTSTCALLSNGTARCWGSNADGQLGEGTTTDRLTPVPVVGIGGTPGVVDISAGNRHGCALLSDGTVRCWGLGRFGQLGDGSTVDRQTAVPVSGLADATAISAGNEHTCAVLSDGTARCWGWNIRGQLGDGTTTDRSVPVQVAGLTGATTITAGWGIPFTCAIVSDGTAQCWGDNQWGQLGGGTLGGSRASPGAVVGLTNAKAIHGGGDPTGHRSHACAVVADGTARCWGENVAGQIGDGTQFGSRPAPTVVSGLTSSIRITTGNRHSCATIADGTARCWGDNGRGQVGDGSVGTVRLTQVAVSGLGLATRVEAGQFHTCATRADGTARCWGWNIFGQLGDGTTIDRALPTPVSGPTGASAIDGGDAHTCTAYVGGTARCWGYNGFGQLGDGTTTDRSAPVQVVGLA